jgi:cytoskeletal protein RodZ
MAEPVARTERDPLRVVTVLLLALMVAAFVGLTWYLVAYAHSQRATSECYQQSFDELRSSLQVSREAARTDRIELRDLIQSISDPDKTPAERRTALEDYVAAIDQSEQARALAPLPARTCG